MRILLISTNNENQQDTNKKFWEELIAYFLLIRHGSHRKRRFQQFLYCCVCIRCRGSVYIKPLPGKD
jgi:hypothetical protein